jgi:DedD protein
MLIIVIAGVVFIPDLLDGQKSTIKEDVKKIPPRPASSESPIIQEFPMAEVKQAMEQTPQPSYEIAEEDKAAANDNTQVSVVKQESSFTERKTLGVPTSAKPSAPNKVETEKKADGFERAAWVLRLGTFRNKPNVDALLSKLEAAGVTTFVKPVEAKAGTLYRVFVGPELEKSKLEKAQKTLKALTGLDGKITEFTPIN